MEFCSTRYDDDVVQQQSFINHLSVYTLYVAFLRAHVTHWLPACALLPIINYASLHSPAMRERIPGLNENLTEKFPYHTYIIEAWSILNQSLRDCQPYATAIKPETKVSQVIQWHCASWMYNISAGARLRSQESLSLCCYCDKVPLSDGVVDASRRLRNGIRNIRIMSMSLERRHWATVQCASTDISKLWKCIA